MFGRPAQNALVATNQKHVESVRVEGDIAIGRNLHLRVAVALKIIKNDDAVFAQKRVGERQIVPYVLIFMTPIGVEDPCFVDIVVKIGERLRRVFRLGFDEGYLLVKRFQMLLVVLVANVNEDDFFTLGSVLAQDGAGPAFIDTGLKMGPETPHASMSMMKA